MERRLKERLIGAAVLVMLAVIFIPMILSDSNRTETAITKTNIPQRPEGEAPSHIAPLQESDLKSAGEEGAAPAQAQEQTPAPAPEAKPAPAPKPSPAPEAKPAPAPKPSPAPEAKTTPPPAPASPAKTAPESKPAATASGQRRELTAWVVQVGSFSGHDNANRLLKKLQGSGYAAFIEHVKQDSETVYRVRVGPEVRRSSAESLKEKLAKELKIKGMLVLQYP
jgi:DedD protein